MALPPFKVLTIGLILSFSGTFHFGYQFTVVNPTESVFKNFLNQSQIRHYSKSFTKGEENFLWTLILNLPNVFAMLGTMSSSSLMEKSGRKRTFYIMVVACAFGPLMSGLSFWAFSWEMLTIGKIISGFGYGISICLQPTYFAEVCDTSYSGFLGAITGMVIEFGFTLGSILALPALLGTTDLWPWLLLIEVAPNILALFLLPFLPESPKFLMSKNPSINRKLAVKSMQFFERQNIDRQLEKVLEEIQVEKSSLGFVQIFQKPYLRRGLFLACVVQVAIVFSGVLPMAYYSTRLFLHAGATETVATYGTVLMCLLCFNSALISCFILDKVGRRTIMICTCTLLAVLNMAYSIISQFRNSAWSSYLCVVVVNLFFVVYGLGPSTVPFFIAAELMPQKARSMGIMVTMIVQWTGSVCSMFIYDALVIILKEWTFMVYAWILFSCVFCFWKMMPETKGKDTIEIMKSLGFDETCHSDHETVVSSL